MKQFSGFRKTKLHRSAITAGVLGIAAAAMVFGGSMNDSGAYFSTYVNAAGSGQAVISSQTELAEDFKTDGTWRKEITVSNTGNQAEYVRVQVIAGDAYTITPSGEGWSEGSDGYWYYSDPVEAGADTSVLTAQIVYPEGQKTDFNVIVVQESVPVSRNYDGRAFADWSGSVTQTVSGGEEAK